MAPTNDDARMKVDRRPFRCAPRRGHPGPPGELVGPRDSRTAFRGGGERSPRCPRPRASRPVVRRTSRAEGRGRFAIWVPRLPASAVGRPDFPTRSAVRVAFGPVPHGRRGVAESTLRPAPGPTGALTGSTTSGVRGWPPGSPHEERCSRRLRPGVSQPARAPLRAAPPQRPTPPSIQHESGRPRGQAPPRRGDPAPAADNLLERRRSANTGRTRSGDPAPAAHGPPERRRSAHRGSGSRTIRAVTPLRRPGRCGPSPPRTSPAPPSRA